MLFLIEIFIYLLLIKNKKRRYNIMSDISNIGYDKPTDKVCLKICFVCKDVAKYDQGHMKNYGGIVCFSCRAF